MSSDILSRIIERKAGRLSEAKAARPLAELRREALAARADARPHHFRQALEDAGRVNVIAEFKRASPSKGEIRGGASVAEIVSAYERGGAAALSVLTEEDFFRGSLADLKEAKASTRLPVIRKDFVFDEYQVFESAAAGARIVGVNNRDLRTFEVSLETSVKLAELAPAGTLLVSESGLRGAGDVDRVRYCGFRAFLVGETLMRSEDPEAALRYLAG